MALKVCRICGGNKELKSILDEGPEMVEKLLKCTDIQVFREDSLPNFICQQCDQHLDLSYKLRQQSKETASRLKKELKFQNQPDIEEPTSKLKVETAYNEDIKINLQYTSTPFSIQMPIETSDESTSNNACKKENKPIHLPLKIEPSDIDEEEFQTIDNSNTVLENNPNDAYKVSGSIEARSPLITPAQYDIKIEEVKLIPPDQISMDNNDGNDAAESQNYLQMQQNDMFIEGDSKAPSETTSFLGNDSIDSSLSSDSSTEDSEDINLSSLKSHQTRHLAQLTCPSCSKVLNSQKDYVKHLKEHEKTRVKGTLDEHKRKARCISKYTKKYICNICKQKFAQLDDLKRHMELHSDEYGFTCQTCFKSFKKHEYLDNHIIKYHPKSNIHQEYSTTQRWTLGINIPEENQCNYCGIQLRTSFIYQRHIKRFHPTEKPPHTCKPCNKEYFTLQNLNRHKRRQHSRHKCDICLKSFTRLSNLRRHKKIMHSKLALQHSCLMCPAKFRLKDYLNAHMLIHTNKKSFKCEPCNVKFSTSRYLSQHEMRKHSDEKRPHKCEICSEAYVRPDSLKRHIKKLHSDTTTSSLERYESKLMNKDNQLEDSSASSNISNKDAEDNPKSEVIELMGDDHKIYSSSSNKEILWDSQKNTPKRNQCGYCGKQLKTSQSYKLHLLIHTQWTPGDNIPKKNQCDFCGEKLKTFKLYQNHIKSIHPNEKPPHKCKTCNKEFYALRGLTRHETLTHTANDNKPYKCDNCLKSFKYLSQLTRHEMVHSDLPPQYSCSICPTQFRYKGNLDVHMRCHSKDDTETLEEEDSEFIIDNRLEHDGTETSEYESNMCNHFLGEYLSQLPSTSKTQIRIPKCSISPQIPKLDHCL